MSLWKCAFWVGGDTSSIGSMAVGLNGLGGRCGNVVFGCSHGVTEGIIAVCRRKTCYSFEFSTAGRSRRDESLREIGCRAAVKQWTLIRSSPQLLRRGSRKNESIQKEAKSSGGWKAAVDAGGAIRGEFRIR